MENILQTYNELSDNIMAKLIYKSGYICTPFVKKTKITYADFIASGLPSPHIEQQLQSKIYPYYSNTHSNAHNGIFMKNQIGLSKLYMRQQFKIDEDYKIIFPGNGCTGAINHLVNCINYSIYDRVFIFISLYEHYSNHLPWQEIANTNHHISLIYIPFIKSNQSSTNLNSGLIDLNWLDNYIQEIYLNTNNRQYDQHNHKKTLIICSITACSNITGIIMPLQEIRTILNKYESNANYHSYFFSDFACSAPYVDIDGKLFDAFYFSPHKFIGGPSTPGVLIGKSCLFAKSKPQCSGGGCVVNASSTQIIYESDIERRESAGTPNILGIIRLRFIMELKANLFNLIRSNECKLSKLIKLKIRMYESMYDNFRSILYNDNVEHLPILSFNLSDLHYNFVVVLFNDLFGIQTRGGIGCCGLLAEYIKSTYNINGWCRISFHWTMKVKTIENIFKALEFIIQNGHKYFHLYDYDTTTNLFKAKQ